MVSYSLYVLFVLSKIYLFTELGMRVKDQIGTWLHLLQTNLANRLSDVHQMVGRLFFLKKIESKNSKNFLLVSWSNHASDCWKANRRLLFACRLSWQTKDLYFFSFGSANVGPVLIFGRENQFWSYDSQWYVG